MASNKYTQQPPISGASTKVVLAERVYYAALNTVYADPVAKLNGADPAGWSDMGIVANSQVQLTYTKEIKDISTGIEKIRRGSYSMAKTCQATWSLEQYDIDTISIVAGLNITAVGSIGGKLHIGQDDLVEKSLLFIGTNKVDGKEHQGYAKRASINWAIDTSSDMRIIKVTADLYAFTPAGETVDAFITLYVLD